MLASVNECVPLCVLLHMSVYLCVCVCLCLCLYLSGSPYMWLSVALRASLFPALSVKACVGVFVSPSAQVSLGLCTDAPVTPVESAHFPLPLTAKFQVFL